MDRTTKVKLKKRLNINDLAGEKVMIDFDSGKYFLIKGAGNDIWDLIQEETTVDNIIKQLLEVYDVSEEECESCVMEFLSKIQSMEFI